jgi:glutamyl-tRNA synthetase
MSDVRVRIAPSPTGEDLHIGNLYTAMMNWVWAQKNHGKFIVRIEDTDRDRFVPGAEERILQTLADFGLNNDEGPNVGGEYSPYKQSERLDIYKKYALELVAKNVAYYCFCSKERLEEIRNSETATNLRKKHWEYCQTGSAEEVDKRIANGEKYVIRLKVPQNEDIVFTDLIRGEIKINSDQVDDQVLLKSDGFPTYHLAVVVDDYLMKISHIIRAEEWISSTPKHVLLYKAFGWEMPIFAHMPILRNSDKSKLSKRKNPVWVSWFLKEGYLSEAILNYLATMGWSHPEQKEIFSIEEFIQKFELKDVSPVGPAFDIVKLDWMNGEYIRAMSDEELTKKFQEYLVDHPAKDQIAPIVPLIKERIKKLSDFIPLTDFFFEEPEYDMEVFKKLRITNYEIMMNRLIEVFEQNKGNWDSEKFAEEYRLLATELEISNTTMFQLLRVAFTGQLVSPPLFESIQILGEDKAIQRFKKAKEFIENPPQEPTY